MSVSQKPLKRSIFASRTTSVRSRPAPSPNCVADAVSRGTRISGQGGGGPAGARLQAASATTRQRSGKLTRRNRYTMIAPFISEERRVGKEWVSTGRSGGLEY